MADYTIDSRSQKVLDSLHEDAAPWFKAFLIKIHTLPGFLPAGCSVKLISGHRSWDEQNALYAQGRSKPGRVVTNARGGYSNHNFGIAVDVGVFQDGNYLPESPLYSKLGPVGKSCGLSWGGDWKSIKDLPHFEVPTGYSLASMRDMVLHGRKIPVPKYVHESVTKPVHIFADLDTSTNFKIERVPVTAVLEGGSTYVNIDEFCHVFGGKVSSGLIGSSSWVVALNNETLQVRFGNTNKKMVKFSELNKLFGLHPTFTVNGPIARLDLR